ncbi:MAG: hypothetical protein ACHQQS_15685 [Thermoanaerobaculales bacterium]
MKRRITFTIEGLPQEGGYVRLSDFLGGLENLKSVLTRTDRFLSKSRTPTVSYRIVGLSANSPAQVVLEAYDPEDQEEKAAAVVDHTFTVMSDIEFGTRPGRTDYPVFESIRNLAAPVGITLTSMSLVSNGTTLKITPEYRAKVDLILAPEETSPSFVRGMLDFINIHGAKKVFRIYPAIGPTKLTCHFPEALKHDAIAAIGQHVEIHGVFKYKRIARFAHEVEVREIKILPEDKDIPRFETLTGAAPGLTGGISSVDYVRAIRNAKG